MALIMSTFDASVMVLMHQPMVFPGVQVWQHHQDPLPDQNIHVSRHPSFFQGVHCPMELNYQTVAYKYSREDYPRSQVSLGTWRYTAVSLSDGTALSSSRSPSASLFSNTVGASSSTATLLLVGFGAGSVAPQSSPSRQYLLLFPFLPVAPCSSSLNHVSLFKMLPIQPAPCPIVPLFALSPVRAAPPFVLLPPHPPPSGEECGIY